MRYKTRINLITFGALALPLVLSTPLVEREDTTILGNYVYPGCREYDPIQGFSGEIRVLDADPRLTATKCAIACASYPFFATAGTRCACSNTQPLGLESSALDCEANCPGGGAAPCGSSTALRVYLKRDLSYTPTPSSKTAFYKGCMDSVTESVDYYEQGVLTLERCQSICEGYRFYGLVGSRCSCSDTWQAKVRDDLFCRRSCPGNFNQICGSSSLSPLILSVYTTQTACEVPISQQIVRNPSFELGTAFWTVKSAGQMSWSARGDTGAPAGTKAARIDSQNPDPSAIFRLSQGISTCPGLYYTWTHASKQTINSDCSWRLLKDFETVGDTLQTTSGTGYSQSSYDFLATDTSAFMTLEVQCSGLRAVKSQFFDNIQLRQAGFP